MAVGAVAGSTASSGLGQAALGAAGSIGGGILGGLLDFPIQKSFVTKQSRHQRKWTEYMSNTQYQRAVRDLAAAGLNPMLAYTQGGAGYSAYQQAQAPDLGMEIDVGKAVGSARGAIAAKQELRSLKAQADEAVSRAGIAENEKKSSDKYWEETGRSNIEVMNSTSQRNMSSAVESVRSANVLEAEKKIRDANAASAQTLEALRGTLPGKALIILKEILGSTK